MGDNMNIASQSRNLNTIISRYFVSIHNQLLHYGDCEIYLGIRPFCGCGFLHLLGYLDYNLASIVYPQYENDLYLQDTGKKRRKNKKKDAEAKDILEKVFGKIEDAETKDILEKVLGKIDSSFEELKYKYNNYEKILNNCFTKKDFPQGFRRLDNWLKKEVARD